MENLINSIKSIPNLYKKNDVNSIDVYLDLPLQSLKSSSSVLLRSSIFSVKNAIGSLYLTKLDQLKEESGLLEAFYNYPSLINKTFVKYTDESWFRNFQSNFEQIKDFVNLIKNTLEVEGIDPNEIVSEYKKVLSHIYELDDIIVKFKNIDKETMSFFAAYNKLNSLNTIFIDYKEIIGDKYALIEKTENIIPYTSMSNPEYDNIYKQFELINDKVITELINRNESKYIDAASYYKKYRNQENSISDFLFNANINSKVSIEENFPENSKISKFILFKDNTSIIEYKNGEINKYGFKLDENSNFRREIEIELINNILHKKPQIAKFFVSKISEDKISGIVVCIDAFLKNEKILKNSEINILSFKNKSTESIYDYILKIEKSYKVEQMCKKIMSNKYKDLFNKRTKDIISELYDKGVTADKLQDFAGKKLAIFKSPEEFNNYLDNILSNLSDFSHIALTQKLNLMNISPILDIDNKVVFEVSSFIQSKALGSNSWCISREEHYFEDYTSENSKQYFLYDFNKSELDMESMIGFTLYENGNFRSQHLKNDDYIEVNKSLEKLRLQVIDKDITKFNLCEDVEQIYKKYISDNNKKLKNGAI
jgi:hypothetical protein